MARLILKSPYIKGGKNAGGHARYIATRERVELVPDGRPATKKQEQLIASLTKDFPDTKKLPEYSSYQDSPTKVNASVFITQALEDNWPDVQQSDIYAEYIATRPRVERMGSHGLFGDEDYVDLKKVTSELQTCEKNVWTHIISLKREDAARLGYDNARTWRNLIRAHRNDIAAAMNIPPNEFCWYAAFHDKGGHPHVHMMAWSAGDAPGYLSPVGIQQIKSMLTNDIFRQKMLHVYEQKSQSRDELMAEARRSMLELASCPRGYRLRRCVYCGEPGGTSHCGPCPGVLLRRRLRPDPGPVRRGLHRLQRGRGRGADLMGGVLLGFALGAMAFAAQGRELADKISNAALSNVKKVISDAAKSAEQPAGTAGDGSYTS